MRVRPSRWTAVAALCVAASVTAVVVAVLLRDKHKNQPVIGASTTRAVTIPGAGGARLAADVYTPAGSGPFPLVVMPASWGSKPTEYTVVATGFAALGYLVVAYAQRGFGGSTGTVDFAGPTTRGDVGTVIDWARAHSAANDGAVAAVGASYGAGISLLAAEHDRRIKAVAAISGWADFAQAIAPGGTIDDVEYQQLFTTPIAHAQLSGQLRALVSQFAARQPAAALATLNAMSPVRSPLTGVGALNQNRTAVFLASTYQDSIVQPSSLIELYRKLTGPKHLELAPGDHGASALPGLFGQQSALWVNIAKWVAHYINGAANADVPGPVRLTDAATGTVRDYRDWSSIGRVQTVQLAGPNGSPATGPLESSVDSAWTDTITAGVPTTAEVGPEQATTGRPYQAPTASIASISRTAGLVWSAPVLASAAVVSGMPQVHIDVSTTATSASLFAYLYDVGADGTGMLISHGARTLTGAPGAAQPTDIALGPIAWTVQAGHHLSLVVDSVDARYLGQTVAGSTITLSATAADPATLTVPVG